MEINFSRSADVPVSVRPRTRRPFLRGGADKTSPAVHANPRWQRRWVMTVGVHVRSEDTLSPSVRLLITRLSEPYYCCSGVPSFRCRPRTVLSQCYVKSYYNNTYGVRPLHRTRFDILPLPPGPAATSSGLH